MFKIIGLTGIPRLDQKKQADFSIHKTVMQWLKNHSYQLLVEDKLASHLQVAGTTLEEIGQQADLGIVIGGDGNMLSRARTLSPFKIPLLGINRGNLGFLTDIDPQNVCQQLESCLIHNQFFTEDRFLLQMDLVHQNHKIQSSLAVNEVVIHHSQIAHIIELQVFINDKFAFSQRADGLIVATPTGSTAYSLSAGGSIMTPDLNAIALVPMFPHTLSSRPLIIDGNNKITIKFPNQESTKLAVSCDSQVRFDLTSQHSITIQQAPHPLKLLHLNNYNYYNVLSSKLGWQKTEN